MMANSAQLLNSMAQMEKKRTPRYRFASLCHDVQLLRQADMLVMMWAQSGVTGLANSPQMTRCLEGRQGNTCACGGPLILEPFALQRSMLASAMSNEGAHRKVPQGPISLDNN